MFDVDIDETELLWLCVEAIVSCKQVNKSNMSSSLRQVDKSSKNDADIKKAPKDGSYCNTLN